MEHGKPRKKKQTQLSAFDLDAMREAFKRSVRENNVSEAEWAEYARKFVDEVTHNVDLSKAR
jgi:hypothetical protein